jgi:hypothetical protein
LEDAVHGFGQRLAGLNLGWQRRWGKERRRENERFSRNGIEVEEQIVVDTERDAGHLDSREKTRCARDDGFVFG